MTWRGVWLLSAPDRSARSRSLNSPGVWPRHTPGFLFWQVTVVDRAVVFIDGNNWFHGLCRVGVEDRGRLDYKKISEKLVAPREWVGTRYYIGQINQRDNAALYAQQRSFLARLANTDPRISVHFGRIEPRIVANEAANELQDYLTAIKSKLDASIFAELSDIAKRHTDGGLRGEGGRCISRC